MLLYLFLEQGGFLPEMTRREAAQILGVRDSAAEEKVKEAHRKIMIANHPDAGRMSTLLLLTCEYVSKPLVIYLTWSDLQEAVASLQPK